MPNSDKHIEIGVAAGVCLAGIYNTIKQYDEIKSHPDKTFDVGELIGICCMGAICGGLVALLPDLLEPAIHPHHRQFFHSTTVLGLLGYAGYKVDTGPYTFESKVVINSCITGYMSHLIADAQTPMGLKLI